MRSIIILTVFGIVPMLVTQAEEVDTVTSKKIEGTWSIVSGANQGKELRLHSDKILQVIIGPQTIVTLDADENEMYKATYQLDMSEQPFKIDMTTDMPNMPATKALGILQLDGNRMRLCYALSGGERPTRFQSNDGSHDMLFEMKRSDDASSSPDATKSAKRDQQVLITSDNLIGATVMNSQRESLGEIGKVIISSDRRMTHAVVNVGGVIGIGAEQVAVPLRALRVMPAEGEQHASWLTVNATLKDAPRLETENYLELADPGWLAKNAQHYQIELQIPEKITIIDVSSLMDQEVFGRGGDSLAHFEELVFDLRGHKLVTPSIAILSHGGVLGVGMEYVAIDFEKVKVAADANSEHRIVVDLDANQLAEQQEVTPDDYPELRLETVLQKIAR